MLESILKYPRTPHLEGSRLQKGDTDKGQVPYARLQGQYIVLEEKVDGANAGISFSDAGELLLQSRGHYLTGGGRENQFALFKSWATHHQDIFLERLEDRYIVYGEWMFAKHTMYYDRLSHMFQEFDVWDKHKQIFLSTAARRELLAGLPIESVPVLHEGVAPKKLKDLTALLTGSAYQSENWKEALYEAASAQGVSREMVEQQTLMKGGMEGGYIKIETEHETIGRLKWVRSDFLQTILDSGSHHRDRVLIENKLAPGVDIFAMLYLQTNLGML